MGRLWTSVAVATATAALAALGGAGIGLAQDEWNAPAEAKALSNPVNGVGNGRKLVEANCASCHGSSGRGDGPAVTALAARPADWTSAKVQSQSDGELFWKISNGRGTMPPWKHLPEKGRWEIVNYLRTLKK